MGDYIEEDHRDEPGGVILSPVRPTLPPRVWSDFMRESYHTRKPPAATGTVDVKKVEEAAREKLRDRQGKFLPRFVDVSAGADSAA